MRFAAGIFAATALWFTPVEAQAPHTPETALAAMEFCAIAAADSERATEFGARHGLVHIRSVAPNRELFGTSAPQPFPWLAVETHSSEGRRSSTCGFQLESVGEVPREAIAALAARLGFQYRAEDDASAMVLQAPHFVIVASMGPTRAVLPCPGQGSIEVPDEFRDTYLELCGRAGFQFRMMGAWSREEIAPNEGRGEIP